MSRLSLPQGASPCAPAEGAIPHRIDFKFRSPSRPSSASTATMAAAVASVQLHGCVRSGRSSRNSGSAISAAPAPVRASRRAAAAAVTCSAQAERQSPLVIASQQPILPPRRVRGRAERSGGLWACRERAREAGGAGRRLCRHSPRLAAAVCTCRPVHSLACACWRTVPCRTQDMAGDPFGLLLRQRIVFFGGEVRAARGRGSRSARMCSGGSVLLRQTRVRRAEGDSTA